MEKGSWIVKQAVGQNTPVLLGKKLTTKYFSGPNYIEVSMFLWLWRLGFHGCGVAAVCGLQKDNFCQAFNQGPSDMAVGQVSSLDTTVLLVGFLRSERAQMRTVLVSCRWMLTWAPRHRHPRWWAWWRAQSRTWSSTWLSCCRCAVAAVYGLTSRLELQFCGFETGSFCRVVLHCWCFS